MNKEQVNWAKCVIMSYRYLERMCGAIDKQIEMLATRSYISSSAWEQLNSVHNVSKKIIDLSQKKIDYINLKVLTEKILESMNKNLSKILILKHIKNVKASEISAVLKITDRTLFRKINSALEEFAKFMLKFGFSYEKMEIMHIKDDFIGSIYNRIVNDNIRFSNKTNKTEFIKNYKLNACFAGKNA